MSTNASEDAEFRAALERASKGIRDREEMRKACIEMDAAREALRQRVGILNVAVELVREARDE